MAGLVIIDNGTNTVKQIGETAASWLLRTGLYAAANAINMAVQEVKERSKPGKKYHFNYFPPPTAEMDTLKKQYAGRNYSGMKFLVGDIPVNNLILKNKNNDLIEFVDAKIRVTKQNTIIETPVTGRVGTVKEYIAAKDYEISIAGNIMVSTNSYPMLQAAAINEFLSSPESFEVANVYLENLNITNVVFKSGTFNQQGQTFINVLPFDFNFLSDNDSENAYGLVMD